MTLKGLCKRDHTHFIPEQTANEGAWYDGFYFLLPLTGAARTSDFLHLVLPVTSSVGLHRLLSF